VLFSMAQRGLSTPARFVRRRTMGTRTEFVTPSGKVQWPKEELLSTWERPLRLLAWTVTLLALALLATHLPLSPWGGQP
jgi:hypothetical protein